MTNSQDDSYLFKFAQPLGHPTIFPPPAHGKIQASVQFIIPGLRLGDQDKDFITHLAHKCGQDICGININHTENKRTKEPATLVTIAFYVPHTASVDEKERVISSTSRLLAERFLGLLSFFLGIRLSARNIQPTTIGNDGQYTKTLSAVARSSIPSVKIELNADIEDLTISEDIFSALFWLRRGLAERDPVDNFSALMVCLQIMARHIVVQKPTTRLCPSCGTKLETQEPSITSLMRELIVSRLGTPLELFNRLWKTRNAIIAHGNQPVTPETFLDLTLLKFDAAKLAFKSIKLGLGMSLDSPPLINQAFFITDAHMYVD